MRILRILLCLSLLLGRLALAAVPTPESHFGHRIGADRTVLDWSKVVSYFQALEKSSPRIRVKELGKTGEGRPFIAATIADEKTIRNLDHYRAIQQKLADPRRTAPAEAEKLVAEGKTVVMITCSIHATEIASTHTGVELVYKMLTEDKPRFRAILSNTIFLLVPSLNPDGVDIVRRDFAAARVQQIRRPRQQSGLVHLLAARNPPDRFATPQRLASAYRLRRPPAGALRFAHLHSAVARSHRSQHRSHHRPGMQHDRYGHGHGPDRRRQDRRGHQCAL
jgi:hypothetical protein